MKPLPFQARAIGEAIEKFKRLWSHGSSQRKLILMSPTGSGKTYMTTRFLNELVRAPDLDDSLAFVWLSFGDLSAQSETKFNRYLGDSNEFNTIESGELPEKLEPKDILFTNWEKLSRVVANRLMRRPVGDDAIFEREQGYYFEDLCENTAADGTHIVVIVDEIHSHFNTGAATEVINLLDPRVIIGVSATPGHIPNGLEISTMVADMVHVSEQEVIDQGLIKKQIVFNAEEAFADEEGERHAVMINAAIQRRDLLKAEYEATGQEVCPLIIIQLPNDESVEAATQTTENLVRQHLNDIGVQPHLIATWLANKKENLEGIEHDQAEQEFPIGKQAIGTGWDCHRADILVMFRDIGSDQFHTQVLGRLKRLVGATSIDYSAHPMLLNAYVFTNHSRENVLTSWDEKILENAPLVYDAILREQFSDIDNLVLPSQYSSRVKQGGLGVSAKFQASAHQSLDDYFGITHLEGIEHSALDKVLAKGVEIEATLLQRTFQGQVGWGDLDETIKTLSDVDLELTDSEVQLMMNRVCLNILRIQEDEDAKVGNVARSWIPLKTALRTWNRKRLKLDSIHFYRMFINNVSAGGAFSEAITQALKDFHPTLVEAGGTNTNEPHQTSFSIPKELHYTDSYRQIPAVLSTHEPFYNKKEYVGRINEEKFIEYLEQNETSIRCWYMNQDHGRAAFGVPYSDETGKLRTFNPDWIVLFKDGRLGIFDTKNGRTAEDAGPKSNGLQAWLRSEAVQNLGLQLIGGIVIFDSGSWKVFMEEEYAYGNPLPDGWQLFETLIGQSTL